MSDPKRRSGISRKSFLRGVLGAAASSAAVASSAAGAGSKNKHGGVTTGKNDDVAADPQKRSGTRIILLGTAGGPVIRKFRSQPSNLLVVDGTPYMIDTGNGCLRQLTWAGYRPVDVEAVFITHHHLDHNADLGTLISFDWFEQRKQKLPIYGPYGTVHITKAAEDYFSVSQRIFSHEIHFNKAPSSYAEPHDIAQNGTIYNDGKIRVTAAENTHYRLFNAGKDKSFSYRFDTDTRSVVFTGDTGPSDAVAELARGADVLVSEVISVKAARERADERFHLNPKNEKAFIDHLRYEHLPPESVGKLATKAGVKMVVLTHFAPGMDNETDATLYTAGVRRHYSGPVIAGRDLLEI